MPESIELKGEVILRRRDRIAIVRVKDWDFDWPVVSLPEGVRHGDRLTITVSNSKTEAEHDS